VRTFGEGLKALLPNALQLWHAYHEGTVADFATEAKALQKELTYQLRNRPLKDPDNQRRLNELGWHHDRGNLLRFRDNPRLAPTNNRAERALRSAVIARKVSHCSKNGGGAHAFAAFITVVRTLAKQGLDSCMEGLYHLFRSPDVQATPPYDFQSDGDPLINYVSIKTWGSRAIPAWGSRSSNPRKSPLVGNSLHRRKPPIVPSHPSASGSNTRLAG
jgi:hypothetical protein